MLKPGSQKDTSGRENLINALAEIIAKVIKKVFSKPKGVISE